MSNETTTTIVLNLLDSRSEGIKSLNNNCFNFIRRLAFIIGYPFVAPFSVSQGEDAMLVLCINDGVVFQVTNVAASFSRFKSKSYGAPLSDLLALITYGKALNFCFRQRRGRHE
jgi:hypothetical protein